MCKIFTRRSTASPRQAFFPLRLRCHLQAKRARAGLWRIKGHLVRRAERDRLPQQSRGLGLPLLAALLEEAPLAESEHRSGLV